MTSKETADRVAYKHHDIKLIEEYQGMDKEQVDAAIKPMLESRIEVIESGWIFTFIDCMLRS